MTITPEDILKLALAVLAGGLIGAEREFQDKAAGFRTLIFICVGATLFTIFSIKLGGDQDAARIASSIVTGVGFLGAGVIMRESGRVMGLTTASIIWLTAALGMGIGGGYYAFAFAATGVTLVVLWLFPKLEGRIDQASHQCTYEIITLVSMNKRDQLEALIRECGLNVLDQKHIKAGNQMVSRWKTVGRPSCHEALTQKLFQDSEVKEFRF